MTYYVDPVTKEASWEKPAALQWRAAADEQVGGEHAVQQPVALGPKRHAACKLHRTRLGDQGASCRLLPSAALLWRRRSHLLKHAAFLSWAQGRTYYFNEATTATQWEVPAVLAWKQMAAADKSEL